MSQDDLALELFMHTVTRESFLKDNPFQKGSLDSASPIVAGRVSVFRSDQRDGVRASDSTSTCGMKRQEKEGMDRLCPQ